MSCSQSGVKKYDLLVDGYHTPLSADVIAGLYRAGRLRKNDPCREAGTERWRTLDELFPLLKYDSTGSPSRSSELTNLSTLDRCDGAGLPQRAMTSALKAGWICFGLGLAISWFFPLGNVFFSIALITAIVAMCTHQVNRGLVLLISSFGGIGLSAVIFFGLALGAVAVTGAAAMKKVEADLQRTRSAQQQSLNQLNSTLQQLQAPPQNIAVAPVTLSNANIQRSKSALPSMNLNSLQAQTIAQLNAPAVQAQRTRATNEAVRQAEMQRDRINAKEKQIDQLQKSIEWNEDQIRRIRAYGGNERIFVEQRDQLVKQKWELQGR
jgi:hypothetical protein